MDVERLDDLRELIGEYWCLAFAEGQEGRSTDTPDGAAQKCISAIEAIIREARAALTPPEGWVELSHVEDILLQAETLASSGGADAESVVEWISESLLPAESLLPSRREVKP